MTRVCSLLGCPCQNPVEDEEPRGIAPTRPHLPGRPMPEGWKQRVAAELDARKRQRTTVCDHDPDCEDVR